MPLRLDDLDERTRPFMLSEVDADIGADRLTMSKNFNSKGERAYPELLREAVRHGNDETLAAALTAVGSFLVLDKAGHHVRRDSAQMFTEGEFNRIYVRGLCLRAIADRVPELEIYRAKQVAAPEPVSEARIGAHVDPRSLLQDLRANVGTGPALGVPRGPNSGLSARLPRPTIASQ